MTEKTDKKFNSHKIGKRIVLLLAAFLTAVAVAVTCVICYDPGSPTVNIAGDTVDTDGVITSAANSQNLTVTGEFIKNGQYKDYTPGANGSSWAVLVPRGTYKLEAWGARGGKYSTPGYGGYTYGTFTTTGQQYIYIYVGGVGKPNYTSSGSFAGGFNGGGRGYRYGASGGGATHFATADGELKNLSGNRNDILIVAGGGGGAQQKPGGNGGGGNRNGVKCPATYYGTGGCGGGTTGPHGDQMSGHSSGNQSGSFGLGGDGKPGGDGNGGGGGGGGFYGGCGNTSDGSVVDDKGGGGGSGHINTSRVTGGGGTTGNNTANDGVGRARLTAINVNTQPTNSNPTISGTYYRGGVNISVLSRQIAQDPDYQNASGSTANSVYFTAGSSSNYDTVSGANAGLFLDASCTKVASNYLSWTWSSTTLTINSIKRYPRSGVDGQNNGQFVLYTRVRDNFGTNKERGVSVCSFKINVSDRAIAFKSTTVTPYSNGMYRVGNSTSGDAAADYISNTGDIYNPAGAGKPTVFIPKPISPSDKTTYTISAANIYSDADTAYDKVAIKSVTIPDAVKNYFTVTYNADSTYTSGLYPSISIKATGVRPPSATYAVLTINAQSSETTPKLAIGSVNSAVQLVFKISNTRPYFASSTLNTMTQREPLVELTLGGADSSKTLTLNDFLYDIDDGPNNITSSFVTTAGGLKIPQNEYVSVDMTNYPVELKSSYVYGGQTFISNYRGKGTVNDSGTLSSKSGEGKNCPTGFKNDMVAVAGSAGAATANVVYSYENNGKTIRFTARAATQYQYGEIGRLGDFYVLVRVVDPSDPTDDGIWYPIAIKVNSQAPTEPAPLGSVTLNFESNGVDAGKDVQKFTAKPQYMTPISYVDGDGVLHGVGYYQSTDYAATPFAVDADGFKYSDDALNDLVVLDGGADGTSAILNNDAETTGSFFHVEPVRLTASWMVFSRLDQRNLSALNIVRNADNQTATFWGLKITPLRSTGNEYFRFGVRVKDSHGTPSAQPLNVCVRVVNRSLDDRRDPASSSSARINALTGRENQTPRGSYGYNDNIGASAVNYVIENMDEIQITPYDLAYDLDMDPDLTVLNPVNGATVNYNTNPLDTGFAAAAEHITHKYNIAHSSSTSDAPAAEQTTAQLLSFVNPDGIVATAAQYSGYIGVEVAGATFGDTVYSDIPCIKITGLSRTTSAIVQLRFEITDGFESKAHVVTVTVLNSSPLLNTIENHPKEPTEDNPRRIQMPYTLSATVSAHGYNNAEQFLAREIAYDKDGDTPTFVAGTAKIVAEVDGAYYEYLTADFKGLDEKHKASAAYTLSDYAYATITKDSSGNDVVYVRALSSTEFFPVRIYLQFSVQDGFRAQMGRSDLRLLIDIKNSDPYMNTDGLSVIRENEAEPEKSDFGWRINYEDESELRAVRFIANSEELYDGLVDENGKTVVSSNKIWLFGDADAQQRVLLNPSEWTNNASDLVVKYSPRASESATVTADSFKANPHAAIMYTARYTGNNAFINISVLFYEKTVNGSGKTVFRTIASENNEAIRTAKYWAIRIVDETPGTGADVQIAIAVRDDHHGLTLYKDAWKGEDNKNEQPNKSDKTVLNFFYGYNSPGVIAMHTTYRTDGNAEAQTVVGKAPDRSDMYLVDYRRVTSDDFKNAADKARWASATAEEKQKMLETVEFVDSFKYRYFVKSYSTGDTSVPSYKWFGSTTYEPIPVSYSDVGAKTYIPMSYIAMPKGHGECTEPNDTVGGRSISPHVVFANVSGGTTLDGSNKLLDANYTSYGHTNSDVFANLSLTDGSTTWSGSRLNDNPYIDVEYVTTADANVRFENKYLNTPFKLSLSTGAITQSPMTNTNFREDKYGFSFSKKSAAGKDSVRAPGMLKFTVAVKTVGKGSQGEATESNIEYVDVDVNLVNTRPESKYISATASSGMLDNISVKMTMDDTAGKSIGFIRDDNLGNHDNDTSNIYYKDHDKAAAGSQYSGDTMKFYMPSAFGTLTESEVDYIMNYNISCSRQSPSGLTAYYGVTGISKIVSTDTNVEGEVNRYNYNPNPHYDRFFSVSPASGSASKIQFIPKAKTQPLYPEGATEEQKSAYRTKYNLGMDSAGVYYPFKVLYYDDCNGSTFTQGYWTLAVIKVYITNNKITYNKNVIKDADRYTSHSAATQAYNNMPMYKFDLSANTAFMVDVTSLLVDNDIDLDKNTNTFVTDASGFEGDDAYIKDYLNMPVASAGVNLNRLANPEASVPVTVRRGGDDDETTSMPKTTLVFKTTHAFKERTNIAYTFSDSSGDPASSVTIVFSIGYNNAAPKAHNDTFAGSDTIDVYMKHGDSFVIYAGDSNDFAADVAGGFESAKTGINLLGGVKLPFDENGNSGTAIQTAADMMHNFRKFVGNYPADRAETGAMGSIVLASDDAASTLRIQTFSIGADESRFVRVSEFGGRYKMESDLNSTLPIALRISALGAITTDLRVTIVDGNGATVVTVIRLHVLSTPPAVNSAVSTVPAVGNPTVRLVKSDTDGVFNTSIPYGTTARFAIASFMTDVDTDDASNLRIYTGMDGTEFSVNNANMSLPTVTVSSVTENYNNYIDITAVDYILQKDQTTSIRFRVVDRNGAISDYITINVSITPAVVTAVAGTKNIALMSYSDFVDVDGNASLPVTVALVSDGDDGLFKDPDVTAPTAQYNVVVYALIKKAGDAFVAARPEELVASEMKICGVNAGIDDPANTSGEIYRYVSQFFAASVSLDGKQLEFIPNSATFNDAATAISSIPLYISVSKRYIDAASTSSVMAPVYTSTSVSVANSKVTAVENSPFNTGYPLVGEKPRESDFLEFTGKAGDSLTWKLYDNTGINDYEYGLFYDWDMRRASGGKEKIEYVGHRVVMTVPENVPAGKGDVLSVSHNGIGAAQTITIKINRKVYPGTAAVVPMEVWIYAADSIGKSQRPTIDEADKVSVTKIKVNVQNDVPEIATTGLIRVCPVCGNQQDVKQVTGSANRATCPNCNSTFKSLDPDLLGYNITLSEVDGYVLDAKLENGKSITLNIADIIDDADIAMDGYSFVPLGSEDSIVNSDGQIIESIMTSDGSRKLFDITTQSPPNSYGITSLSRITFTCRSTSRGQTGTVRMQFRDSVEKAETHILTVNLTVDNIAPKSNGASTSITMMGAGKDATEEDISKSAKTFNIVDYVTDDNGDAFNAYLTENAGRYTYVFIDSITVFMTDDIDNAPKLYGYGVYERDPDTHEIIIDSETGNQVYAHDTLCTIEWADDKHQSFKITPFKQVYGVQKFTIAVSDSGYEEGINHNIIDGKTTVFTFTVTIANPLDDVAETLDRRDMVYGVTRPITSKDLLGSDNAQGYTISAIEEEGGSSYLKIYEPTDDNPEWRIFAQSENVDVNLKVTFTAGGITVQRTLPVRVVANNAPDYKNGKKSYTYTTNMLTGNEKNQIKIYPEDWFEDRDAGDVMSFVSPVESSQNVKVEVIRALDENGKAFILLTFHRRGEANITVNVSDLSGRNYQRTITVNCTDAPELSMWENFVAYYETNTLWFWLFVGAGVVLLVLIIVIIVVVHKKRKMRREIEALLESETELEEEMMRLSAGTAGYQSFGFLPPAQAAPDPGLMLGGGASAPGTNSLQLNAGTGAPTTGVSQQQLPPASNANSGVPPTQTMQPQQGMPQQPQPQQPQQGMPQSGMQQPGMQQGMQQRPMQPPPRPGMPQQGMPQRPYGQQGMPQQQQRQAPMNGQPPQAPPTNNDGFNPDDF